MSTDPHVFDEFPLLLAGEADRATVLRVSTHARWCDDCRDELVSAVAAHATLTAAARHAADVATGGRLPYVGLSPDVVVDGLAAAAREPSAGDTVDLGPVFAQIRAEAAGASTPAPEPADDVVVPLRRRRWSRGLAAAAAVVVLGGGGAAIAASQLGDDGRTVTVSAYGAGTSDATARVGDGWMTLDASSLPRLASGEYYEVWLVDAPKTGLLALGSLGGDNTGSFSVPQSVMDRYSTLQVTLQQDNGNPAPSDVSVLRASL